MDGQPGEGEIALGAGQRGLDVHAGEERVEEVGVAPDARLVSLRAELLRRPGLFQAGGEQGMAPALVSVHGQSRFDLVDGRHDGPAVGRRELAEPGLRQRHVAA